MSIKTNFGKWTFDRKDGLLAFYDKNIPGLITRFRSLRSTARPKY